MVAAPIIFSNFRRVIFIFKFGFLKACCGIKVKDFNFEFRILHSETQLAGVAGITIRICSTPLVAIDTPGHIVSVNHLDRPFFYTCKTMTDGAIHFPLNMNPVRKDDKFRELIHSLPGDLPTCLNILDDFKRLRSLADRIRAVTGPAEFDIGNPGRPVSFRISMAEGAI